MPIWIALYQSITRILATGLKELLNLSRYLYPSWHIVFPDGASKQSFSYG